MTPFLPLSIVQFDNASCFADTFESFALAYSMLSPDPCYGFLGESSFQKVIHDIRDGIHRTSEDVKIELIRIVPVTSISLQNLKVIG